MSNCTLNRRRFVTSSAAVFGGVTLGASSLLGCRTSAKGMETLPRPSSIDDYTRHDAIGLAQLVSSGEVSPSEVLEWAIGRCEAVNPQLNAVVIEHFDRARSAAMKTLPGGPLRGVPFLLKDLWVELEGTVTTNGSRFWANHVARQTSTLIKRYEEAGLVIFGKTASPEFGSSSSTESLLWGDTRNPWDVTRSSGGSSGGSAVAVAAGIVPAAHASDGGGSIRIPSSCCGIFGLKPSRGRTPGGPGAFDKAAGVGIAHVVSRTVRDSALLLDVSAGPTLGDPYVTLPATGPYLAEVGRAPGSLRIGVQREAALPVETHPDCLKAVDDAVALCSSLGHELDAIAPPPLPGEGLWKAFGVLRGTKIAMAIAKRAKELGREATTDDLEPNNWRAYEGNLGDTAIDFETQRQYIYALGKQIVEHQHAFDVVVSPTLAAPPPKLGVLNPNSPSETFANAAMSMAGYTIAYNVSGQPAISVPLHWNDAGVPIGVMFAGRPGAEGTLLRLASQLEQATPWIQRRPPAFS